MVSKKKSTAKGSSSANSDPILTVEMPDARRGGEAEQTRPDQSPCTLSEAEQPKTDRSPSATLSEAEMQTLPSVTSESKAILYLRQLNKKLAEEVRFNRLDNARLMKSNRGLISMFTKEYNEGVDTMLRCDLQMQIMDLVMERGYLAHIEKLQKENDTLKFEYQAMAAEVSALKAAGDLHERSSTGRIVIKKGEAEDEAVAFHLEKQIMALVVEGAFKDRLADFEKDISLKLESDTMAVGVETNTAEVGALKANLADLKHENDGLKEQIETITEEVRILKGSIAEFEVVTQENDVLKMQVVTSTAEVSSFKASLSHLKQENEGLKAQVTALKAGLDDLKQENDALKVQVADFGNLFTKLADLKVEAKRKAAELSSLDASIVDTESLLEEKFAAMFGSG